MKKLLVLLLLAAFLLALPGCGAALDPEPADDGRISIVASDFPAYDFSREIAGERARVTLLVPPGSESHSYEPTPRDIIMIENCDILVCAGGESEEWLSEILEGTEGNFTIVTMLDCVDALEEEIKEGMQSVEEEDGEEGPEYDEHVWTSPVNAQLICNEICAALMAADPDGAELYGANLDAYCAGLEELDSAFRETVADGRFGTLVFADRFPVRYFVEEYGLDYFAAFPGCADDTEPSAKTVAFLIDRVREEGLPYVLYIEFSNEKMADIVCEDTGCGKLLFHSCHNVSAEDLAGGVSYMQLMRSNLATLKEALG